jgi:hypothetical protein
MAFVFKRLSLLSIAAALLADKAIPADKPEFKVAPASSYPSRQTNAKVTVAARPYESDEEAKGPFGKHNPYKYGVLPVLVVIQNDSHQAIRAEQIKVTLIGADKSSVDAIPAGDVKYLQGAQQPNVATGPIPTGPRIGRKKNPLDSWQIEGRAFTAKMIPAGESANGFFYFQTGFQRGSKLYVTGLSEAGSGKELFYFEIPLERASQPSQ